jgi:predicted amidohydrolase
VREQIVAGLAQWLPRPGRPELNLAGALAQVAALARRGADLIVLPELWPCGYDVTTLARDAATAAEPLDGQRTRALGTAARDHGVWLAAGSVPERAGSALHNTALLFDRSGELRAWHRKTHLYAPTGEDTIFTPGDRLTVCDTGELGVVGLCVCFDGDFPETARGLRQAGATLVIAPAAYEAEARDWWETLYPAAALANGQWWVMANQCGATGSGTLLGASQVLSPLGAVVARAAAAAPGACPPAEPLTVTLQLRAALAAADPNRVLWELRRPDLAVRQFGSAPARPALASAAEFAPADQKR